MLFVLMVTAFVLGQPLPRLLVALKTYPGSGSVEVIGIHSVYSDSKKYPGGCGPDSIGFPVTFLV